MKFSAHWVQTQTDVDRQEVLDWLTKNQVPIMDCKEFEVGERGVVTAEVYKISKEGHRVWDEDHKNVAMDAPMVFQVERFPHVVLEALNGQGHETTTA